MAGAPPGFTVWLTGLPSAGKSTLAEAVAKQLAAVILDGDELRRAVCADLGFSVADRAENVRRIAALALEAARGGAVAVVAAIAPLAEMRDAARAVHEAAGVRFVEVFVDAPLAVCAERDVKGLYAAQREGRLRGLTGVDAAYEPPVRPDVRVPTATLSLDECVRLILSVAVPRFE